MLPKNVDMVKVEFARETHMGAHGCRSMANRLRAEGRAKNDGKLLYEASQWKRAAQYLERTNDVTA